MSFPLKAVTHRAGIGAAYPNTARRVERIHARPACKKALERGDSYRLLG